MVLPTLSLRVDPESHGEHFNGTYPRADLGIHEEELEKKRTNTQQGRHNMTEDEDPEDEFWKEDGFSAKVESPKEDKHRRKPRPAHW
eukprot:CAMPEP_0194507420 /NCGR_PEP_ID=MMETSP0253-20130528/36973_1 /TAXON_ID=2966 /ORGANISM="Noctiluca scintillans" /LENGTH=86 /DNA_ID=CAMNT_0039350321 /DNA_START=56 /DNA_END=316 /DNA_ORIENTATION=-